MAGNRRHAGGMSSAMANLKEIDAKIAAGRAARATTARGAAPVPWPTHRLIRYARNYLGRGDVALARGLLDEAVAAEGRADSEGGALSLARDLALASLRASFLACDLWVIAVGVCILAGEPVGIRIGIAAD